MIGQTATPTSSTPQPSGPVALDEAALRKMAQDRVAQEIAAQKAPIDSARAAAAARAAANAAALAGTGAATAELMRGAGAGIQSGYSNAAGQIGQLAGGFSAAAADRVRAAQAANDSFVQGQVKGAGPSGQAPDATSLQDSLYAMQGFVPASSLAAQGAAARTWGETLPGLASEQTQGALGAEQARAAAEDQSYADKLIELAAREPAMRTQALDQLYAHELEKLNARLAVKGQDEQTRQFNVTQARATARDKVADAQWGREFMQKQLVDNRNFKMTKDQWAEQLKKDGWEHDLSLRGMTVQEAAQSLYEQQFAETKRGNLVQERQNAVKLEQDWKSLGLQGQQLTESIRQHNQAGHQIDASASRVRGFVVDTYGRPVLSEAGTRIVVPADATISDRQKMYQASVVEARSLKGSAVKNDSGIGGKYIARAGASGVIPAKTDPKTGTVLFPASTDDPAKAQMSSSMTFVGVQSYLQEAFGLTKAQARKAAVAAGWKPDGKRP